MLSSAAVGAERFDAGFLRSALSTRGPHTLDEVRAWLRQREAERVFRVQPIPFAKLERWSFAPAPRRLVHDSGAFFSVEGLRTTTNFGAVPEWDQPIINQPEIGLLGIVTRVFDGLRCFLMQAKAEPGNLRPVQLSPTVQATRSNYVRVHQGKLPRHLEHFTRGSRARVLVDQFQGEQGSCFLHKRNRNVIVEIDDEPEPDPDFRWLTLGQIKALLHDDNLVNMDTRSVVSCIRLLPPDAPVDSDGAGRAQVAGCVFDGFSAALVRSMTAARGALHSDDALLGWLNDLRTRYQRTSQPRPLDELLGWREEPWAIRPERGGPFSVIAVEAEISHREIARWTQPILTHSAIGLYGFVAQRKAGGLHLLVAGCSEPGGRDVFELGPTVSLADAERDAPFVELFRAPAPGTVRHASVQSEEGGRFYHDRNRYMIVELPAEEELALPENYSWMTLRQLQDVARHGYVNVEARSLLTCLELSCER